MFDANAKLPSGILNGNVNQFGDFDQCLAVQEPPRRGRWSNSATNGEIQGKYCLAYLQPTLPENNEYESLQYLYSRVQSLGAFRSNFDDVSSNLLGTRRGITVKCQSIEFRTFLTRRQSIMNELLILTFRLPLPRLYVIKTVKYKLNFATTNQNTYINIAKRD